MRPSREIRDLVLGWYHDVSGGGDATDILSMDADAIFIGTGPGEYWIGGRAARAALRLQSEGLGGVTIAPGTIRAYEEGTVGWATDACTIHVSGNALDARITLIFHREGSAWKMVHGHVSHEVGNAAWGVDIDLSMDRMAKIVEHERPDLGAVASPEGTVTIVFTDLEGSTAMNEALGDDRFVPLLIKHRDVVHGCTLAAGGSVVKSEGDGFMLAFPSARKAVDCAVAVQRATADVDDRLKVRMGVHTGEPTRHADDFYGRDVAYSARLGAASVGGEILVSSLVKSLVEPSGSHEFAGPRELELNGFEGPQQVFEVLWRRDVELNTATPASTA